MAKKQGQSHKRNRARYKLENRYATNKQRKAAKQKRLNEKLLAKGKGPLVVSPETAE